MASAAIPDPSREYQLIEKLELRIAGAKNDEQFEEIIQKFLPALILKLASDTERNRNLAIKVCQYVSGRLKINNTIQLPLPGLFKNLQSSESAFVRRFSLVFIQQGTSRVKSSEASTLLPEILKFAVPTSTSVDATGQKLWAIAFDFLLDGLRGWKPPERGSKEDSALKESFALSTEQCEVLVEAISRFLLYDPKIAKTAQDLDDDFRSAFDKHHRQRTSVVPPLAYFLFCSVFDDNHRLVPATIMSVDANSAAANKADVMFKQCDFDLEAASSVDALFNLYDRARPRLQTKILTLLTRSQKSTEQVQRIHSIIEQQLASPESSLEIAKLRASLFSYLTWAVRVGSHMAAIADRTQALLKDYIEMQGWPTPQDKSHTEVELRAKAYESIGLLAAVKRNPAEAEATGMDLNLLGWLFTSLRCDATRDVRASIEESLSRVMNVVMAIDNESVGALRDLLLWNAKAQPGDKDPVYYYDTINSTKYVAVRFANKCLRFSDPIGRLIDVLAFDSTERKELADEGARGLDPSWHRSNQNMISGFAVNEELRYPSFAELIQTFFGADKPSLATLGPTAAHQAIVFCRNILVYEALHQTSTAIDDSTDWQASVDAAISNDAEARAAIRMHLDSIEGDLLSSFISLVLQSGESSDDRSAEIGVQLLGLTRDRDLNKIRPAVSKSLRNGLLSSSSQYSAARALGVLESLDPSNEDIVRALESCREWKKAVGAEAVKNRGQLLLATYTATRRALRSNDAVDSKVLSSLSDVLKTIILETSDLSIKNTAISGFGQVALCTPPSEALDLWSEEVNEALLKESKKQNENAVTALGRIVGYQSVVHGLDSVRPLLDRLMTLHEVKQAEFHFALGEAFAVAMAGFQSTSTMTELDVRIEAPPCGNRTELQEFLMTKFLDHTRTTKPTLRKAAAIWLLSVVQFCGDCSAVTSRLRDCQAAFAKLLSDRDDVTQEAGSRGLGIVYEKGDKNLKDDLVRDLVQSFTGTGVKMSGSVDQETQLFEAGALPTEGGQSVTTYKDIVSLATEMGDPSLVYRFMNLASNNAIWSSRAAFGKFGLSNVLADSTYLAENKKFYPKLFRYRFDPNPNVQRSMNEIWRALVKDSSAVVNENFGLIMEDLLKSVLSGKEWRTREASCAAIADLVSGREIEKLESYLDEIWKVAFKVLDDVKETVRVAAMQLCRTLTNMLVRNLEVGQGSTKRATTLLNHAMPFLLKQMEGGQAQEVQQYATVTLLEVVKKSPPKSLQSFAPLILETLVNSLSTLEHEGINYLHLNAEKYGLTAEKLDKARVSSINASPVTEAIDRCLESLTLNEPLKPDVSSDAMQGVEKSSPKPMDDAMRRLEASFKTAIGLPSRVGLSRVIVTLVVRHPTSFRPYADRFAQLNRKHVIDRNATISVAFSTSLGYLMRLVSEKEVRATSKYAQKLYFESQDLSHRAVAGEILQSISKTSNDVFVNYASTFLPFAFVGRNDTDEEVRERFDPPWKDNIGGSRAVQLYLQEISDLVMVHIKSPLWPIRHACCLAVAELVNTIGPQGKLNESEASLVWPMLEEALNGKTWEGKEKVVLALPKFVPPSLGSKIVEQMAKIAIREAKRKNVNYRPHAIVALGDFAKSRTDASLAAQIVPVLQEILEEITDVDAMDVDSESVEDKKARLVLQRTGCTCR